MTLVCIVLINMTNQAAFFSRLKARMLDLTLRENFTQSMSIQPMNQNLKNIQALVNELAQLGYVLTVNGKHQI